MAASSLFQSGRGGRDAQQLRGFARIITAFVFTRRAELVLEKTNLIGTLRDARVSECCASIISATRLSCSGGSRLHLMRLSQQSKAAPIFISTTTRCIFTSRHTHSKGFEADSYPCLISNLAFDRKAWTSPSTAHSRPSKTLFSGRRASNHLTRCQQGDG